MLTEAVAKERIETAQKVVAAAISKNLLALGTLQKDESEFVSVVSALVAPLGVSVRHLKGEYWYEFYVVVGAELAAGGIGGPVRKTA